MEESSSNIVLFPSVSEFPTTHEEARDRIEEVRREYAEEISDECLDAVMSIFRNYGYLTNPNRVYIKDVVAISELFKSVLLRYNGIDHPMQDFVDQAIDLEDKPTEISTEELQVLEEFAAEIGE